MDLTLKHLLKENDWIEIVSNIKYRKGTWTLTAGINSWWIISTEYNPNVFEVTESAEYDPVWTVNLIEHLCKMEDERTRLRKSLEFIQTVTNVIQTISFAQRTLEECYHTWLDDGNKLKCPICRKTKMK